ncbi:MAG: phosphate/phosphite/phosphonate ABC transporter substrate-binding protein [Alphaproteobacteria bacterium]
MIAALGMYDWPQIHKATDQLWAAIALGLRAHGLAAPDRLDRETAQKDLCRDPNLLLAQTCGYPYVRGLRGVVHLVATPKYRANGCQGSNYCSWLVVRAGDGAREIGDLAGRIAAFNSPGSQSGYSALRAAFAPLAKDGRFFGTTVETGGHLASLQAVAGGTADVCAVDAVCWALAQRHEPDIAERLRVLAPSPTAPGLPLITGAKRSGDDIAILRQVLNEVAGQAELADCRAALLLDGFEVLSDADYDRIEQIEARAVDLGYPVVA